MKALLPFVCSLVLCSGIQAQIAINNSGAKADSSAILDVSSNVKGILVPRMSGVQRTMIHNPSTGLLVFDTDKRTYYYNTGLESGWRSLGSALTTYDTDRDTGMDPEKSADEDIIHFDLAGTEYYTMYRGRLEILNSGESVLIGNGAGANDDLSFNRNVLIGSFAGSGNTEGSDNTAIGYSALSSNNEGTANTAIGANNQLFGTIGEGNSSLGAHAMRSNSTGSNNVAIGVNALYNNTEASNLVAIGDYSLYNNGMGSTQTIEGSENTAVGSKTLFSNTIGYGNTAAGGSALFSNVNGDMNTAYGNLALYSNQSGSMNTAVGRSALFLNFFGGANTAVGVQSLFSNITGFSNTAFGVDALYSNLTGNANVALGFGALYSSQDRSNNIAIGDSALYFNSLDASAAEHANLNTAVGSNALYLNTSGGSNSAIGNAALSGNTTGQGRTGIGAFANSIGEDLNNNTGIGYSAFCTASNQIMIGNPAVDDIGGFSDWTNMSDARFKTNVRENVPGLEFITSLRPVTYTLDLHALDAFYQQHYSIANPLTRSSSYYDRESEVQSGFIAQEVEESAMVLGFGFSGVDTPKGNSDFYGLRYAQFVVPLVKSVQELNAQNTHLQNENLQLHAEITALKNQYQNLSGELNNIEELKKRMDVLEDLLHGDKLAEERK